MYQFKTIFKIDFINLATNPMWIFYGTGFPLALILILGFLTSGSYGNEISSFDYYGITIMIFSALNAATYAANSFMEERIKSPNMRIIHTPVPPMYIYLSKIAATVVFTTLCYTVVGVILHVLLGVHFGGMATPLFWLLMVIVELFAACLSIMLCCLLHSEETANAIVSNLIALLAVLGGLFFPVDGFGGVIAMVSNLSPVKWIATATFQGIYDGNFTLYLPTCLVLIVLSVVCVVLANVFFRTEDYV